MYNLGLQEGLHSLLALWSRLEQLRRWSVIRIESVFTMLYCLFHPQITIVETGEYKWLGIGITNETYNRSKMPGWIGESLGYHTDDGNIFYNFKDPEGAKLGTKGIKTCQQDKTLEKTVILDDLITCHVRGRGQSGVGGREEALWPPLLSGVIRNCQFLLVHFILADSLLD